MRRLLERNAPWSIRAQLVTAFVVCISVSLLLLSFVVVQLVGRKMQAALEHQIHNDLVAKRVNLSDQIESYFGQIRKQLVNEAHSQRVILATSELIEGFQSYAKERSMNEGALQERLLTHYEVEFAQQYQKRNQHAVSKLPLSSELSSSAKLLQHDYIAANPHPLGEKQQLGAHESPSRYSRAHAGFHAETLRVLKEFGYYDVFVIDAERGDIVYSSFKEVDFATNLLTGPFAQSALAKAFHAARKLPSGEVYLSDFAPYRPSYDDAASFMATPIYAQDEVVGVLAFQMPIHQISELVSQRRKWTARGLGKTGQIFVVGKDKRLRNENRFFLENEAEFLTKLDASDSPAAHRVKRKGTTVIEQEMDGQAVGRALEGFSGFVQYIDSFGDDQICSYGPLNIENQRWAIVSQIQRSEAYAPVRALREQIVLTTLFVMGVLLCGGVVIGLLLVRGVTRPLERLTQYTIEVGNGQYTSSPDLRGCSEAETLGHHFSQMVKKVSEFNEGLARKVDERTAELQRAVDKLESLNRTDPLTGVSNRRYFEAEGAKEVVRGVRYQTSLSVVMFDVDHFKSINDNYGHASGDMVLKEIAAQVQESLRSTDIFARVGGEEFCILLPGVPLAGALGLVERLRSSIEKIPHRFCGEDVTVTASFGVATLGEAPDESLEKLTERADKALYRAKNNGRNRCESCELAA